MSRVSSLLFCLTTNKVVIKGSCASCPLTPRERRHEARRLGQSIVTTNRRKHKRRKLIISLCRGVESHKSFDGSELIVDGIVLHQLNKIFGDDL